ncbi:PAS domain S-box protein [Rhizobacter sp. SG703]|uniref:PAS domain S-box protein n=1 Tax=Rhizobacter sp. SG703 TaxID=2587140 RepID=UPI0014483BEE|nr:PAS domain S-box protein [Rhizobacter sp. SG703]NKI96678.1 PAS domain S-box-containing protein [Rhizobacter sp. SG703]
MQDCAQTLHALGPTLFERLPQAALLVDAQGHVLAANRAAQALVRGGDLPSDLLRFVPSLAMGRALDAGEEWSGEVQVGSGDGVRPFDAQLLQLGVQVPLQDSQGADGARFICLLQPSPVRGRDGERDFRSMADAAPVMIWLAGPDRWCEWVNKPWLQFTGTTLDEERGNGWTQVVHPEDLERCMGIYSTSFHARQPFVMDYRLRRHDGIYRWVLDNGVPHTSGDGRFLGYVGSCVDIHERKELEERLAERTQAMRLSDRRQGEFLALLSHELRNPLAPIANAASVLRTMEAENPTIGRLREIVERQVTRLRRLIDDLVDVTRVAQGQITLIKEPVAIDTVVRGALDGLRTKLSAAGHTLKTEFPKEPAWVDGDALRLAQAVSAIVYNASIFSRDPGEILVSVQARCGEARDQVQVRVKDRGQGISADFLPHVFELFARHDAGTAARRPGLGVGLTLARRIAMLHGGDISASSDGPGLGAEFVISLPQVASPAATTGSRQKPLVMVPEDTYRVLVIDPDPETRDVLRLQMELWGHEVQTAPTPEAGLRIARSTRPQIVLCDISHPDFEAAELLEPLRSSLVGMPVFFAALNARGRHDDDEARALEAGFDAYLVKPLRPENLGRLIHAFATRTT